MGEQMNPGSSVSTDFESIFLDIEEESKFQKHGKQIAELLRRELDLIKQNTTRSNTRLHKHQIEAVLHTFNHFRNQEESNIRPALITAPSGSGKSGMVILLPFVLTSKKVLILTPSNIITDQIAKEFGYPNKTDAFFLKSGILKSTEAWKKLMEIPWIPHNTEEVNLITRHNLVILNAQKLLGNSKTSLNSKNPESSAAIQFKLLEFDTIIVDEAHHYSEATWGKIVKCFQGKKIVFLTATPFRRIGENILHIADLSLGLNMNEVYNIQRDILEGNTIRKLQFVEKPLTINSIGKHFTVGPENIQQLKEDIQNILDKQKRKEPRLDILQVIVVVRTKAEAKELSDALGPATTFIVSDKEGPTNLIEFTKGNKQIAVVCGMLKEGYDNSNVTLCVFLFNCKSRILFEQYCGRCMRLNRNLPGNELDKTVGTILSYEPFQQRNMWETREIIADEDSFDDNE